jgi:hypothetical protein
MLTGDLQSFPDPVAGQTSANWEKCTRKVVHRLTKPHFFLFYELYPTETLSIQRRRNELALTGGSTIELMRVTEPGHGLGGHIMSGLFYLFCRNLEFIEKVLVPVGNILDREILEDVRSSTQF